MSSVRKKLVVDLAGKSRRRGPPPARRLGARREVGGGEDQTRQVAQIVVVPPSGRTFEIGGDVPAVFHDAAHENALELAIPGHAVGSEQVARQQPVRNPDRHLHGGMPVHPVAGRVRRHEVQNLVAERVPIPAGWQEARQAGPGAAEGQRQLRQMVHARQLPGDLHVHPRQVAVPHRLVPAERGPAVPGPEVEMPIHGPVVRPEQPPHGSRRREIRARHLSLEPNPCPIHPDRGRLIAVPPEARAVRPVHDRPPARPQQIEALLQIPAAAIRQIRREVVHRPRIERRRERLQIRRRRQAPNVGGTECVVQSPPCENGGAVQAVRGFSGQQPARHPARLAHQRVEPFSEEHGRWGNGSVGL